MSIMALSISILQCASKMCCLLIKKLRLAFIFEMSIHLLIPNNWILQSVEYNRPIKRHVYMSTFYQSPVNYYCIWNVLFASSDSILGLLNAIARNYIFLPKIPILVGLLHII